MTKGLANTFGLPTLEEVIGETDDLPMDIDEDTEIDTELTPTETADEMIEEIKEKVGDHARAMDLIYEDTLKHASDIAELAFDMEPTKAPRMLEVAAIHYKTAMDAKEAKLNAVLKLAKVVQDMTKLRLEAHKVSHETGETISEKANVVMVEDRNVLLEQLRAEALKKDT